MLESYDLKMFGLKLKNLRVSLGYTQHEVKAATGIHIDTLRKIENGYAIPRYDTLSHLSAFFKRDLHKMLCSYQNNHLLFNFLNTLDGCIIQGKHKELKKIHQQFKAELYKRDDLHLVNKLMLNQIDLFVLALTQSYKGESHSSLKNLTEAIRLATPEFELEYFDRYKYSFFEIRMLIIAAASLGDLNKCELSIRISEYILTVLETNVYSDKIEDIFVIKSLCNISYNYHRLDTHTKALDYAEKGIEISIKKGHLDLLFYLYLRQGVALFYTDEPAHVDAFKKCLYAIKISGNEALHQQIHQLIKTHYKLDFSQI